MTLPFFVFCSAILAQLPTQAGLPVSSPPPVMSERESLVRPRTLTLDYRDMPMSEVIKDITAKTGCRVSIFERQTDWLETRITLRTPDPVSFWTAVDKVCEAGQFGSNLGADGAGTSIRLFRGYSTGPASNHGPFRVQLDEIFFRGRVGQLHTRPDGQPASRPIDREEDRENSFIELGVWVEPRMLIKNAGKLKGLSAVDELGQSLIPADPAADQKEYQFGFTPAASTLGQIPLLKPEKPGKVIKTLRGVAPVVVARLRPEPLDIPLLGASGKSIRGDATVVTVRDVSKQDTRGRIVIEAVGEDGQIDRDKPGNPEGVSISLSIRPADRLGPTAPAPEVSEDQFEVVDASGKVWGAQPRIMGGDPEIKGNEVRVTFRPCDKYLRSMPWPGDLKGFTLRYREMTAVPVDVPFEFKDVPLP